MSKKDHGLDDAYSVQTPEDSVRLYRDWAESYDSDFAQGHAYRSPGVVARRLAALGGTGPVLDVGAGTGLVGEELARLGISPVDGLDISPEMLEVAREKGCYRALIVADVTRPLEIAGGYRSVVSAGTFTTGHVGPEGLAVLLGVAAPGARFVVTILERHFESAGFAAALESLPVEGVEILRERAYGPDATHAHAEDLVCLTSFRAR